MIDIALYQPDIPQNTGTMLRMASCMGLMAHLIHPLGFVMDDRKFRRSLMDYGQSLQVIHHDHWDQFYQRHQTSQRRIVLLTTQSNTRFTDFKFEMHDTLLVGRESAGVPPDIHQAIDYKITIPMHPPCRSLNVAVSLAMVLSEAMRQLNLWSPS